MPIQLEFNIDNKTPEEVRLSMMQKQIDESIETLGKVRRRLFAELGEMKKVCATLQKENQDLKEKLHNLTQDKIEWTYGQNHMLFDIKSPIRIESQS
jgi:archaellum component FlaC